MYCGHLSSPLCIWSQIWPSLFFTPAKAKLNTRLLSLPASSEPNELLENARERGVSFRVPLARDLLQIPQRAESLFQGQFKRVKETN